MFIQNNPVKDALGVVIERMRRLFCDHMTALGWRWLCGLHLISVRFLLIVGRQLTKVSADIRK